MGEPGGVGPEIALAAWRVLKSQGPVFFLIADPALFSREAVQEIAHPEEAAAIFPSALPLLPLETPVAARKGEASPENAPAVIESIEHAVALSLAGAAAGVVTNPIQKSSLIAAGFKFPGHTEFLADLTSKALMPDGRARGPVMMLAGPELKT
ncbi:MAG: 4-hydroxythreonine-4-phosphate dehydrogenase PdxA, partial [Oricola sp.]|nr:4-hydroxythreonine-4-phosphate dehydrogenase PdxA [Oricola sp.]